MKDSIILDNVEIIFKVHQPKKKVFGKKTWLTLKNQKEIINCFVNQHQKYIHNFIKIWISAIEKRTYSIPNFFFILIDFSCYDLDKINKKYFVSLCYPYTHEHYNTYRVIPDYITLNEFKEYLKNKIVDKYLIDDVRDLIII